MIGSGETNTNLGKYLVKQGFSNFVIFNRTTTNAKKLGSILTTDKIIAEGLPLEQLKEFEKGFDVLIVCTSSPQPIITPEIYSSILNKERNQKIVIDLSVPSNIDTKVFEE